MKRLILVLAHASSFYCMTAQPKELPGCKNIKDKLVQVSNAFDNIVSRFASKEDKVSLIKTYTSDFSLCEQKGKIKDYGRSVEADQVRSQYRRPAVECD